LWNTNLKSIKALFFCKIIGTNVTKYFCTSRYQPPNGIDFERHQIHFLMLRRKSFHRKFNFIRMSEWVILPFICLPCTHMLMCLGLKHVVSLLSRLFIVDVFKCIIQSKAIFISTNKINKLIRIIFLYAMNLYNWFWKPLWTILFIILI